MMGFIGIIILLVINSVTCQKCPKVLTFNTGLTPIVPNYESRRTIVPRDILAIDADVVCLQEYWKHGDVEDLITQVGRVYPYHFSAIHKGVGNIGCQSKGTGQQCLRKAACSGGDLQYFLGNIVPCATRNGCLLKFQESGEAVLGCLADRCRPELTNTTFNAECLACIAITSPSNTVSPAECVQRPDRVNILNAPGLVLLSKKPLTNARYESLFENKKMIIQRGWLSAIHPDIGQICCTHLSYVDAPYFEYDLNYGNFSAQKHEEVDRLLKKCGKSVNILVGNLNSGPDVNCSDPEKNLTESDTTSFATVLANGYRAPYVSQDGRCTFCLSNNLTDGTNELLDHILIRGNLFRSSKFTRVLDQTASSDHYGVQATLCNK